MNYKTKKPYSIEKFVIHHHKTIRAPEHYDLRISIPKKRLVASWALPKMNIPKKHGEKCLAVRTEDHGRYWLQIENMEIEEGEYGAGVINLIQKGNLEIEGWSDSYITFNIPSGNPMNGRYSLIKFSGKKKTDKKNNLWILIKLKEH